MWRERNFASNLFEGSPDAFPGVAFFPEQENLGNLDGGPRALTSKIFRKLSLPFPRSQLREVDVERPILS